MRERYWQLWYYVNSRDTDELCGRESKVEKKLNWSSWYEQGTGVEGESMEEKALPDLEKKCEALSGVGNSVKTRKRETDQLWMGEGGYLACSKKVQESWHRRVGALSDRACWKDEDAKGMQRVLGMHEMHLLGLWYDYLIIFFIHAVFPAVVEVWTASSLFLLLVQLHSALCWTGAWEMIHV